VRRWREANPDAPGAAAALAEAFRLGQQMFGDLLRLED
jgi:hypothetical protein